MPVGILRRLEWGLKWGFVYAIVFSAIASVVAFVTGGVSKDGDLTLSRLIAAYVISGVCVGLIVGVLLPLAKARLGAAVVGVIATVPYAIMIGLADSSGGWTRADTITVVIMSLALGAPVGVIYREIFLTGDNGSSKRRKRAGRQR